MGKHGWSGGKKRRRIYYNPFKKTTTAVLYILSFKSYKSTEGLKKFDKNIYILGIWFLVLRLTGLLIVAIPASPSSERMWLSLSDPADEAADGCCWILIFWPQVHFRGKPSRPIKWHTPFESWWWCWWWSEEFDGSISQLDPPGTWPCCWWTLVLLLRGRRSVE